MSIVKRKNNKGFTLLETIVAIFILMLAVTGPMSFAQNGLRTSILARDQITAFYLAQDAIEFVKNIKDGNALYNIQNQSSPVDWLDGIDQSCYQFGCSIDTSVSAEGEFEHCENGNPQRGCLKNKNDINTTAQDSHLFVKDDGTFTISSNSGGEETIFSRTVYMTEIVPDREVQVRVIVRWISNSGIGPREIDVREHIFNWAGALIE